jgi:hypothetical protein
VSEKSLVEQAQAAIGGGEQVQAAGVFQPRGTEGAATAVGAVGALAGGRVMSQAEGVPRWTLMAVTPAHLYAFEAHGQGTSWRVAEPFAKWEREKIAVTVHGRLGVRTFEVEDLGSGQRYEFEAPRFGPAHGTLVIKLLEQDEQPTS